MGRNTYMVTLPSGQRELGAQIQADGLSRAAERAHPNALSGSHPERTSWSAPSARSTAAAR
eukprot:5953779-Alexandrium_andersonii.AAC.1